MTNNVRKIHTDLNNAKWVIDSMKDFLTVAPDGLNAEEVFAIETLSAALAAALKAPKAREALDCLRIRLDTEDSLPLG